MPEIRDLSFCETQCTLQAQIPCSYLALKGFGIVLEGIGPNIPVYNPGGDMIVTTAQMAAPYGNEIYQQTLDCANSVSNGGEPIRLET